MDGAVDFMDLLNPRPVLALVLPPQQAGGDGGGHAPADDGADSGDDLPAGVRLEPMIEELARELGLHGDDTDAETEDEQGFAIGEKIDDELSALQVELMVSPDFVAEVEDVIQEPCQSHSHCHCCRKPGRN